MQDITQKQDRASKRRAFKAGRSGNLKGLWSLGLAVPALLAAHPVAAAIDTWTGIVNNNWDTTTANWDVGAYTVGDDTIFTDNFAGPTSIIGAVVNLNPNSITFSHIAGSTPTNYNLQRLSASGTSNANTVFGAGASTALLLDTGFLGYVQIGPRAANSSLGSTTIKSGTLEINDGGALPANGANANNPGPVTLSGGTLAININTGGNVTIASGQLASVLSVTSNSSLINTSTNTTGTRIWGNNGSINVASGATLFINPNASNTPGLTSTLQSSLGASQGTFSLGTSSGTLRLDSVNTGGLNLIMDTGSNGGIIRSNIAGAGGTISFGALTGAAGTRLEGSVQNSTGTATTSVDTYSIGAKNLAIATFAGVIANGSGSSIAQLSAILKTGTGTQTFTGANTYTGLTSVTNGKLIINGSQGTGSVSVGNSTVAALTPTLGGGIGAANGGSLSGLGTATLDFYNPSATIGSIGGRVTLTGPGTSASSVGHLAPGNSVGTIGVGSLVLNSGSVLDYEFNGIANDLTNVTAIGDGSTQGLIANGGGFNLFQENTVTAFNAPGTYHLVEFNGALGGSLDNLSVLNPVGGSTYTFGTSAGPAGSSFVDLTIGVPEPTSLGILGLTAAGFLARRRRQIKT